MALVDERRKTLSARLDNTRFRVELEATKHAHTASTEVNHDGAPARLRAKAFPSNLGRWPASAYA